MKPDPDCIFCNIVAGKIPCFKLYEDDSTLAFMDINPASEGPALVIPEAHHANVHDISESAMIATVLTAKKIAAAIEITLDPDGLNLLQCNGPGAAQSVLHFHMHVLPRKNGDDLKLNWGLEPGNMEDIEKMAERIRKNL